MGTDKTREMKLDWMRMMCKKVKDDNLLLRTFCVRFSSTMQTAKEILGIVRDEKLVDRKLV